VLGADCDPKDKTPKTTPSDIVWGRFSDWASPPENLPIRPAEIAALSRLPVSEAYRHLFRHM
jgi:hypothetical protein